MDGNTLQEVTSFKYLGAPLFNDGTCTVEIRINLASAMTSMARLNRIWRCNTISFASKFKLYVPLVTSLLLYECETWTLLADSEKGSRLSKPSTSSTRPTTGVRSKISILVGSQEPLLAAVKTETCMVRECHKLRQPLKNYPSRHHRGWATPKSAGKMLERQHRRMDIPVHARTAHTGLLQKRLEEELC